MATADVAISRPWRPDGILRALRRVVKFVMASAMVLGALMFATMIVPAVFGYKLMVVTSGSMEPTFSAGDVVMLETAANSSIVVGDVITYATRNGSGMTTHRVTDIKMLEDQTQFQTKGDANETVDSNLTPSSVVYGRMKYVLPGAGRFLSAYHTKLGRLLVVGLPALILMIQQGAALLRRTESESPSLVEPPPRPDELEVARTTKPQLERVSQVPLRAFKAGAHSIAKTRPRSSIPTQGWISACSTSLAEVEVR